MTDISGNCIVNPPVTVFCFISSIVLEKKIEVSLAALYVAFLDRGQMRKCFMDGYDGSKTSHHGNEVMVLKSPCNSVKWCFGAQNSVFLIGSGHKCPVPVAEYFLDSRVSLFYHDILEETVTTWFGLVHGLQGTGWWPGWAWRCLWEVLPPQAWLQWSRECCSVLAVPSPWVGMSLLGCPSHTSTSTKFTKRKLY